MNGPIAFAHQTLRSGERDGDYPCSGADGYQKSSLLEGEQMAVAAARAFWKNQERQSFFQIFHRDVHAFGGGFFVRPVLRNQLGEADRFAEDRNAENFFFG